MQHGMRAPLNLNACLRELQLPIQVVNLSSIFTVMYTQPSRYNPDVAVLPAFRSGLALSAGWARAVSFSV